MRASRISALSLVSGAWILAVVACSSSDASNPTDAGVVPAIPPASATATQPPPPPPPPVTDGGTDATDASDAAVDAPADADAGPLSPTYVDRDINHVLFTGQSNAVGNGADTVLTAAQPYTNLMFDVGVIPTTSPCDDVGCYGYDEPAVFAPLVQGDKYFDYAVETPGNGLADEIASLATGAFGLPKHDVLVSIHARSGTTYWCLRKGGCNYKPNTVLVAYAQGMKEVTSAKALAAAAGKSYVVRAVVAVHGEADHGGYVNGTPEFPNTGTDGVSNVADYADALLEWQKDYEAGVKAITAQADPVPLFVMGLSGWNDSKTSKIPGMQLDAHKRAPGKVVLVGPGYPLSFAADCIHYDSAGERRLGEYVAKVYAKTILGGAAWEPLRPQTVTRAGAVITVKMIVPVPPLVLDTVRVTDPGNEGFELTDDSGAPPAITNVAVTAPDTVTITLAAAPGANPRLTYAQNQSPGTCIGPGTVRAGGARGNVRDSDATPSKYGYDLSNWAVPFDVAVP